MVKRETVDIVGDLINSMSIVININTIVDNLDNTYTIETCNTGYLFPNYKFTIDGVNYKVLDEAGKDFVFNEKFTIEGNTIPTGLVITLPELKYYHGTVIATKSELDKKQLSVDKFPMVYLLEVLEDNFNNEEDSRIDRNSNLRLFFLSETAGNDWSTDNHYDYSIKPMRNMVYNFINYINNSNKIGKFDTYKAINHAKFGVYTADKGHTRRVFNDDLSGVELKIDLPIIKTKSDCNNICN